jgi:hypothetical protein
VTSLEVEDRHLSPQGLAEYIAANVPTLLSLKGSPPVTMFIDPPKGRLGLRTPLASDTAPASPLENLRVAIVNADGTRQLEIAATDRELFADVYGMLCAVADRIQLDGMPVLEAYAATLRTWARLLARRRRLSDDQEVGLFGELVLVKSLIDAAGAEEGLASWRGPEAEEHDFGLSDFDLEVKTTTGERRRHWITSLTQLVPTPSRSLLFVSIQLTRAGSGHGSTLTELIDNTRALIGDPILIERFYATLEHLRWDDQQRDLYHQRWQLRSAPVVLLVDEAFPAVTPQSLLDLGIAKGDVTDVRYQIDVTGRSAAPLLPATLTTALERVK